MYRHGGLEFDRQGATLVVKVQDGTTENAQVIRTVVFDQLQLSDLITEVNYGANPFLTKKAKKTLKEEASGDDKPEGDDADDDVDDTVKKMLARKDKSKGKAK